MASRGNKKNGAIVRTPVFAICCVTDSAARPKVQRHHLHNGAYGCPYCLHPGISTVIKERTEKSDKPVKQLRYTVEELLEYELRDDASYRSHMRLADRGNTEHTFGVLGISPLAELPFYDMVFGFAWDYMHGVLEGTTSRLFDLWFNSKSSFPYSIGSKIKQVDARMASMRPPSCCRQPRPISKRAHYKANEWRSVLIFYSLLILLGILPEPYYSHFKKLVLAIRILLQGSFTYDDVRKADKLLVSFVENYENLYGKKLMLYNVHMLLHLGKVTTMLGPIWAYSTFPYESGNGRLVKLAKGTTGVPTQIATKYEMSKIAAELVRKKIYSVQDSVIDFCCGVVSYKCLKNFTRCDGVTFLGYGRPFDISILEGLQLHNDTVGTGYESYSRAVKDGILYHAERNSRQTVFNDTCVLLENGRYAVLELILKYSRDGSPWCVAKTLRIPQIVNHQLPPHIIQTCLCPFDSSEMYPFSFVKRKCLLLQCDGKYYVSEFPNTYEKD